MRASKAASAEELERLKTTLAEVEQVAQQLRQLIADMEGCSQNLEATLTSGTESVGHRSLVA